MRRKIWLDNAASLNDPLAEEIMSGFKQNAKEVVKDTMEGIEMFRFAATLTGYIALLITVYTSVFVIIGYYSLNQLVGAVGVYGTLAAVAVLVVFYVRLRRRHATLKRKYASLFALYDKLGAS